MHLNRWLETHSQLRPQKIALVDRASDVRLTYRDLHRASLATAERLRELGVEAGSRVAVFSHNRPELLELLFACARLGAVFVPLNWRLSKKELNGILGDCQPQVLLVDPDMTDTAPDWDHTASVLGLRSAKTNGRSCSYQEFDEDTPVAIFYTGGTTGTPKGAVLTHRSLQANAVNTITGWGLSTEDVGPVFTPMFHTGGLNVLATPLLCLGGTVVLTSGFQAEATLDILEEEGCTLLFMVPTMFEMLRQTEGFSRKRLEKVRLLISGGAPCPRALFEAYWAEGLPLKQGYGLTEAGPNNFGVSFEDAQRKLGTVGFPLPQVKIELRKADGSLAAPGEVGELCVSGPHLMQGYFQREPGLKAGWLQTGDLAYRDEEGFFFICGRSKEMFISGGENVFPAEIEEVLLDHPAVQEAAVVGVNHPKWGEVGRAYIVAKDRLVPGVDDIRQFCRERLAAYKVPKEVQMMDSLPKSAAGKILKNLLTEVSA